MSIYATLWKIRLPLRDWDILLVTGKGKFALQGGELVPHEEGWVEVFCQAVPGHIGHPSQYLDGDPYADFLPPVVDDPEKYRAVVILQEGRDEKDGQRYVDPLMTLTWDEYQALSFDAMLEKLYQAIGQV